MRKHVTLISLAVTAGLSLSACGVPQADLEALKSEIASLEERVRTLELDLEWLEDDVDDVEAEVLNQDLKDFDHEACLESIVSFIDDAAIVGIERELRWWSPNYFCP